MAKQSKGRVLIVDDKPKYSTRLVEHLETIGHEVIVLSRALAYEQPSNGYDAAAVFLSDHPARGLYCATIRRVRAANNGVSIIGLTGHSRKSPPVKKIERNVQGLVDTLVYLSDGFDSGDIAEVIDAKIQEKRKR